MCQLYITGIFLKLQITTGVQKFFQTQCMLDNQGIYMYKTNTKLMIDHHCTLCINILEIHKPVLLQFRLLSGVLIDIALNKVRKRIDTAADLGGYIKARCKLD